MDKMKRQLIVPLVVILVLAFPSFLRSQSVFPEKMEKPNWYVGDSWSYKVSADGKIATITRTVIQEENSKYYIISSGGFKRFYNQKTLNLSYTKDKSGKLIDNYIPEKPTFKWPLKVANWWQSRYSWQSPNAGPDEPPYVDVTIKVVTVEPLVIMGKEIITFQLLERRYNPRGVCICELTQWISPEFRNIVKWKDERINKYSEAELIKFISGQPEASAK